MAMLSHWMAEMVFAKASINELVEPSEKDPEEEHMVLNRRSSSDGKIS